MPAPMDPNFSAIDPEQLRDLIDSVNSAVSRAQPFFKGYIVRLGQVGLDTSYLTRASQDISWASDQVSMLKRRLTLAAAMEHLETGTPSAMVSAGAGPLQYSTSQSAQKAGRKAAAAFLRGADRFDVCQSLLEAIRSHCADPDYITGI